VIPEGPAGGSPQPPRLSTERHCSDSPGIDFTGSRQSAATAASSCDVSRETSSAPSASTILLRPTAVETGTSSQAAAWRDTVRTETELKATETAVD